jgi:hypothetical protein
METDNPKTLGVAFPIVKMSLKMLEGKGAAGQIASKLLAHQENF